MTTNPKPDPATRNDPDNDNERAIVPAPSGGALAALATLGKTLNAVDTTSVVGGAGTPMLSFKRDGNGTWMYGQKRTVVEEGSSWAVNPLTFKRGFICFGEGNKVIGERLVSISLPMRSPIVRLEKDSYQHGQYGRVWTPMMTIIDWMSHLDGPAPAPTPASPPPAEQPRRRHVA